MKRSRREADEGLIERTRTAAKRRHRAQLDELVGVVRRRVDEGGEGFYDAGEALREMLEKRLYRAAGHRSFEALLVAESLLSYRQANKLVAIVRNLPRRAALSLGQERASALVTYAAAHTPPASAAALLDEGATLDGTPLDRASVRALQTATRALRKHRARSPIESARDAADATLVKTVRAALRRLGASTATVTLTRGRVHVSLDRSAAAALARA